MTHPPLFPQHQQLEGRFIEKFDVQKNLFIHDTA